MIYKRNSAIYNIANCNVLPLLSSGLPIGLALALDIGTGTTIAADINGD